MTDLTPQATILKTKTEITRRIASRYLTLISAALGSPHQAEALNGLPILPADAQYAAWTKLPVLLAARSASGRISRQDAVAMAMGDKDIAAASAEHRDLSLDKLLSSPSETDAASAQRDIERHITTRSSPEAEQLHALADLVGEAWIASVIGDPRSSELSAQVKSRANQIGAARQATALADDETISSVLERMTRASKPCGRHEGLRPREERGYYGRWLASYFGDQGALMPGRNLLLGAASGAGKTSLSAALADDAIGDGCAVHWEQLELPWEEVIGHMISQHLAYTDDDPKANAAHHVSEMSMAVRARHSLGNPDFKQWKAMLSYDEAPIMHRRDVVHIMAEMERFVERVATLRTTGVHTHSSNGLFIVDYVQRMRDASLFSQQSSPEAISGACSALQEHAYKLGLNLILLSQLNKSAQKDGGVGGDITAFKGIDVNFADCAISLQIVAIEDGKPVPVADRADIESVDGFGEPRLLTKLKSRGTCISLLGDDSINDIPSQAPLFIRNRMMHGSCSIKALPEAITRNRTATFTPTKKIGTAVHEIQAERPSENSDRAAEVARLLALKRSGANKS